MATFRPFVGLLLGALICLGGGGCAPQDEEDDGTPVAPQVTNVAQPRVAMLNATTAVISYVQYVLPGGAAEQFTLRYELATGGSELVARDDAISFASSSHLRAIGNGVAILLTRNGLESTRGCAIPLVGAADCTSLAFPEDLSWAAVVSPAAGQAIALYGQPVAVLERTYDGPSGWSASRPGPQLPSGTRVPFRDGVVRWSDGSRFLTGLGGGVLVARYDPLQAAWLAPETLGTISGSSEPQIALHPQAPTPTPIAVWEGIPGIMFSAWDPSSGWSASAPLPGGDGGSWPAVAMWPNGDVIVAFNGDGPVGAVRRINGVWQARELIGTSGGLGKPIRLGMDDQGNAVALWSCHRDGDLGNCEHALHSASYLASGGWQPPWKVGDLNSASQTQDFDVAMAAGGRALAVWSRRAGGEDPGSRLAIGEVGPLALSLTAERYTFGGDVLPLTIRLASAPPQATTVSLSTTLPPGSISLPSSLPVAANQSVVTFNAPTSAVAGFVDGVVVLGYGEARIERPVTLMPEPTGIALTVDPASVLGGDPATLRLQVSPVYPIALDLRLTSNNAIATVPARVTTGNTSSAAAAPVTTSVTTTEQTVTFSASLRALPAVTGSLLVNPTAMGQSVLTASVAQGLGTIGSSPPGLGACATSCTASYPIGTPVTLTPMPASGYRFFGWDGDPDCSDGLLTMTAARACTAIFLPQLPSYPDGVSWTFLGNLIFGRSTVNPLPAMAMDGLNPVVAYVANDGPPSVAQLFVNRFEFGTFSALTPALNVDPLQAASEPSIVTTSNGLPYVAWIEGSGMQQNVYVARWLGGNRFVSVGTPGVPLNFTAGSRASSPSIALDAELRPMVAWIENGVVKLKRFDGVAWLPAVGGEGPASANADRVRLSTYSVFAGVADPVLAWAQGSGMTRALKVARDFAFTPLGTQVNPASADPLTEFAVLAENGGAIVTWGDGARPYVVRSRRWNGSDWVDVSVAGDVASHATNRLLSVAMVRNGLVVAHAEASDVAANGASIQVTWKPPGSPWQPLTGPFPFLGDPLVSLPAVEMPSGNSPIVVVVLRNALGQYVWRVLRYYPS